MVPLFAAWLVFTMKSEEARTRTLKVSTALLAAMVVVSAACIPGLRHVSTTREIVAIARQRPPANPLSSNAKRPTARSSMPPDGGHAPEGSARADARAIPVWRAVRPSGRQRQPEKGVESPASRQLDPNWPRPANGFWGG